MIQPILDSTNGRKTYMVAVLMVVFALLGGYLGHLDGETIGQIFLNAMGLAGLRHGVSKAQ